MAASSVRHPLLAAHAIRDDQRRPAEASGYQRRLATSDAPTIHGINIGTTIDQNFD